MTGSTLVLTAKSHENVRNHVIRIIEDNHLNYALNLPGTGDPARVPEMVDVVIEYILRGTIGNAADVYFDRLGSVNADERRALELIVDNVKISLDYELDGLPGVVSRLAHVRSLLDRSQQ